MKQRLPFGIWLLAGISLLLVFFHRGLFFTIDSANYYSAAFNWLNSGKPMLFDGTVFKNAPPLFVFVCLPAWLFGVPVELYALMLQLFFFLVFVFGVSKLSMILSIPQNGAYLFFISFFGFAWMHVWPFALTEGLFTMLLIWWIYFLFSNSLLGSACVFCLMALLKYQTWYLLPSLFVLLNGKQFSTREILKSISLAILFSGVWFAYLLHLETAFLGEHKAIDKVSLFGILENVSRLIQLFIHGEGKSIVAVLIMLVITSLLAVFGFKYANAIQRRFLLFVLIQILVTMVFIAGTKGLAWNQMPRYLGVFWPLLSISMLISALGFGSNQKLIKVMGIFLGLLCLVVSLIFNLKSTKYLSMSHSQISLTEKDLAELRGKQMLSNFPDLVWWQTKETCFYTRFKHEDKATYSKRIPRNTKYLLWINSNERSHIMAPIDSLIPLNRKKPRLEGRGFVLYELE